MPNFRKITSIASEMPKGDMHVQMWHGTLNVANTILFLDPPEHFLYISA